VSGNRCRRTSWGTFHSGFDGRSCWNQMIKIEKFKRSTKITTIYCSINTKIKTKYTTEQKHHVNVIAPLWLFAWHPFALIAAVCEEGAMGFVTGVVWTNLFSRFTAVGGGNKELEMI
jgi:hypothetical protein